MRFSTIYLIPGASLRSQIRIFKVSLYVTTILSSGTCNVFATEQSDPELLKQVGLIETHVTGTAPERENLDQRLTSIETKLFGAQQAGSTYERLEKIQEGIAETTKAKQNPVLPKDGKPNDDWPALPAVEATSGTEISDIPSALEGLSGAAKPSLQLLITPPAANTKTANTKEEEAPLDEWPTALPHVEAPAETNRAPLKAEVVETATAEKEVISSMKKASERELDRKATDEFTSGHYKLAAQLFSMLSEKKPQDPRYFYGAGLSYKMLGDYPDAFSSLIMSWHLGNSPFYDRAVSSLIPVMQKEYDDTFKVTYEHTANEPEAVLNAGVRMWKAGMTAQSVKLFEYVLKNNPGYRGTAAYNLGAVAEHNKEPKLALEYYKYAVKENNYLQAEAEGNPALSAAINKSLKIIPRGYIEGAISDLQQQLLRGNLQWSGWAQPYVRPRHWSSEVCPLCAISRTSLTYDAGQMNLK